MKKFILLLSLCLSISAHAFDTKDKTINVVIPFAPGGGADQSFRHMQKYAEQKGINLNASYKAGAEGLIGMNDIAALPADGYNLGLSTAGAVAVQRNKNPAADPLIITGIRNSVFAIVVNSESKIYTLKDLENKMRTEKTTFGQGAPAQKLSLEQLVESVNSKNDVVIAAYKGASPAIQDLLGGHIDAISVPLSTVSSHVNAGKLRLLAVTSKSRVEAYPTVPSIFTFYPKWENYEGYCLVVPRTVSPEALEFWSAFMKEYLNDAQVQKDFAKDFTEVSAFGTQKLEATIKSSMRKLK